MLIEGVPPSFAFPLPFPHPVVTVKSTSAELDELEIKKKPIQSLSVLTK